MASPAPIRLLGSLVPTRSPCTASQVNLGHILSRCQGSPDPIPSHCMGSLAHTSQPLQAPPAQPKRSLRWLWITLAIVLVVGLLLGGGGFFAFTNYTAPATAAGKYCGYLKAQNYDSAYGMLSSKLKGQYTSEQFRQASAALDHAEGNVTACGAGTGSNAYKYTLFGNTADCAGQDHPRTTRRSRRTT